ncbi:MAG: sugar transferase [Bacteroidetes bacterium]|nr:sugar transferase [Bacteroidota bacterium]
MVKRLFDIVFSLISLLITFPLFLIMIFWIKIDSKGTVFYRGIRIGKNGKTFKIFKFRSMVFDADKMGGSSTSAEDRRITASGRFIRKWKLDELAQLINVLKGDMSLVGPRPEVKEFVDLYNEKEMKILTIRPGITDWASIWNSNEGGVLEGAIDADAVYLEVIRPIKLELQLYYSETYNFYKDLKILFCTVYKVINSSFVPIEISTHPNFELLRGRALQVIENQKNKGI